MMASFIRAGCAAGFLLLALGAGCSKAPDTSKVQGRVLGYGVLKLPDAQTNAASQLLRATNSPSESQLPSITLTTNRIPARIGLTFGMLYEVSGFKTDIDSVELVTLTKFPTMLFPDKQTANAFTRPAKSPVRDGRTWGISAFTFERLFEIVPGEWQMSVSYSNKTLAQQTFTIYAELGGAATSAPPLSPSTTAGPKAGSGK